MKNKIALYLILVLSFKVAVGQSDTGKIVARFNFLGLVDIMDHNFTPGIEYNINKRWSTGLDAGYIFASGYIADAKVASGAILRPFARIYFNGSMGIFLQGEFQYKRVGYKITDWVGRAPVNGVPAYEEFTTFRYIKRTLGGNVRLGRRFYLSGDHRLTTEFTIGIGARVKKSFVKDGVYTINDFFGFRNVAPNKALPVFPLSFNICYRLK